jgi:hypothetical protein
VVRRSVYWDLLDTEADVVMCKVLNTSSAKEDKLKSSSSSYILFKSSNYSCFDDWSLHRGKATMCS